MERASLARGQSARSNAPPTPPPPKTRARFAKQMDVPVTPTGGSISSFADVTADPEQVDPLPVRPSLEERETAPLERPMSAREAAAAAAEKRMRDSRRAAEVGVGGQEERAGGDEVDRAGEVRVGGTAVMVEPLAPKVEPRSPKAVLGEAATVFGERSHFQASSLLKKKIIKSPPRGGVGSVRFMV